MEYNISHLTIILSYILKMSKEFTINEFIPEELTGDGFSIRDRLKYVASSFEKEDSDTQKATISYLWLTFVSAFIWASMMKYRNLLIIIIVSTVAYFLFEWVVLGRKSHNYYIWYFITSLVAVTISRLLLNERVIQFEWI